MQRSSNSHPGRPFRQGTAPGREAFGAGGTAVNIR